jgi:pimeloyl-ACP methyl ester carboxylesterase
MRQLLSALLLVPFLSASFATYDGARVHYESYGKGKDAIVFIHGWTCDLTFWRGQAPVYEKRRSLLVDLPGHGQSDKPDVPYTQERFARGVEAVMRAAGVERAVVVGHSMGGPVALTFLRLFPAKTRALVLVDAYLQQEPRNDQERTQKKLMDGFAARWRAPNYKESASSMIDSMFSDKTTASQREQIREKMLTAPQYVMASAFEGMMGMEPLKPGETYALPVLAIMADRSGNLGGYEAQLRGVFPNLRYESWQGAGHFLMMESPDRFNRTLEDFLAGAGVN